MDAKLLTCIVIFILTVISFTVGKFSMATTAMFALLALVFTGCLDGATALSGFSNANTIVMATMFVISAGFAKTQMVSKLAALVSKVSKGSFQKVLIGYVLITALLAQFVPSAMAVFSIVFPLVISVCDEMGFSRSKIIFPIGIISIGTVAILPVGSAAVTYIQLNGYLESYEYTAYQFQMLDTFIGRLPSMIFLIIWAAFFAPKFAPEQPVVAIKDVQAAGGNTQKAKLKNWQEIMGYVVFFGVIVGLITQQFTKIPNWQITLLGAMLMVGCGILSSREAYNAVTMGGMVVLYVGTLALGNALTQTGAGDVIGNLIAQAAGAIPSGYWLGFLFFTVPFLLTQVMMNGAVINIFTAVAIITCKALGCSPIGAVILVYIGALTAFMTPMATPTVSMMMGLGGYDQKTMIKMSILPAIIMCFINVVWVMTIFPAY